MTARLGPSSQDYVAAVYEMGEESIPTVQAELARWMGVSPASVSEAVKRMRRDGLVEMDGRSLRFTPAGDELARHVVRRHRLAERFLVEVIGLPWHRAHEEAEVWEHAISDDVEERITAILGDPATCVHGNPIPGAAHPVDYSDLVSLGVCRPGERVILMRMTEDLELDADVMEYFQDSGLMPDALIKVKSTAPDGTLTLEVDGQQVGLSARLTDNLWVRAAAGAG
jgi:DtxR family transcriptional regulator, Mn-dependent transcriptional regulator